MVMSPGRVKPRIGLYTSGSESAPEMVSGDGEDMLEDPRRDQIADHCNSKECGNNDT